MLALAGNGVWVLEDESKLTRPGVGRVVGCWARQGLIAHVEHLRQGNLLELSWPAQGALLRGVMPSDESADLFAGHLVADELALGS